MSKNVIINENKLNALKEAIDEFMVDKNSNVASRDAIWFILYRGDLLFFDYKNKSLLDDFMYRHQNELGDFVYEYEEKKISHAEKNFDNFVNWLGSSIPYLITGYISYGNDVYVNHNENYDILNSNELYQLVKKMPNTRIHFDNKTINHEEILNNKGQSLPNVWYHGTVLGDALKILSNGLKPNPEKSLYKIQHDKTVFFSSSFNQAKWYANYKNRKGDGLWTDNPCILEIDGNKIDSNKIVYDYDVYFAHSSAKNDSVYNDRLKERGLDYNSLSQTINKPTDPRKYLKVGYRGIIMPNAITSVYLVNYNKCARMTPKKFVSYINQMYLHLNTNDMKLLDINESAPEVDEYEIGAESDNPPVGGNGYHINESASFDSSEIGAVNYSWDFDEDEYQEWLQEAEYENTQESLMEYINDNVEFELEYLDNETYHTCGGDYVDYNELEDMFGSKMQNEILTTCMNDGSGSFETVNLYSDDDVDVNNKDGINNMAMKLLRHGDYFKDCRGFILTNGVVVYTESEHNEICRIPNINNKFDFIRMGNIRVLPQSIDIGDRPTSEQRDVLRKAIACYADEKLYLDIYQGKSSFGATYIHPDWRYVMGEIDRFYSEGIKPQGNEYYESKNSKKQIVENKYDDLFNKANYDLQYFLKQGKEKYGLDGWYISSWMEKVHPEISVDPKDIKIYTALSDKLHKITKLWADENNKEENEHNLEQPKEIYDIISLAIEEFGLTSRLSQAGYILPDGKLLNFGSDGYREADHRQIAAVYKQNGIKIWNDEYRYNYVVDFMNHGAIRCDVNSGILDMTKEPTNEQFYVIRDFIRKAVDVDIDFTDDKGNTLHSVSYSDAKPQAVIADIKRYYEDGIKPMGNVQYESKKSNKMSKNIINEYSSDLRLPFEEPEYANKFYIEQYKDWLEDYGKYGKLPNGTLNFWDEIGKAVTKIKDEELHGRFDKSIPQDMSVDEVINDFKTRLIGPYIKFTNDGKIYVERAISTDKQSKGYDGNQRTDFYKRLWQDYNDNVGGCWSYCENGSQAYCGNGHGDGIILRGYIRTDDIDFINTVQLNYHYSDEHEIRVKPFAKVELFNFSYGNDTINFDKGLIVSSTYSGNNSKFVGNVGKIDDGFGNITYINRQNETVTEDEFISGLNKYFEKLGSIDAIEDDANVYDIKEIDDEIYLIELENGKCNIYNNTYGFIASAVWFDTIVGLKNNIAVIVKNNLYNYVNYVKGFTLSSDWFRFALKFDNGFGKVMRDDKKWNFINSNGEIISKIWFDNVTGFFDGIAFAFLDDNKYKLDTSGNLTLIESKNKNKKIVVSENTFESWFGNSILKDENGQPLKMYHGTDSEFDIFSKERIGRTGAYEGYGFNFTPFESRARGYNSINVIEAYLKVENPMTTKSHKITLNKLIKIISELDKGKPFTDTIVAAYEPARYKEKWDAMYYRRALPIAAKTIYNYNKENNYGDAGLYAEICLCGQSDKIETINLFERLGYDSAIFYDNNDRINTVIVFEPNQIKRTSNKTFNIDSDSMNEQMTNENFDFEVDSSEIDLSSFKKKHELVPNIWKPNGKLDSRIRLKLLDIADDFWKYVNLTWVEPSGIILTGSICNFNWSQYSDIDLHLIVDFDEIDEKTEFVRDYLDAKKNEWNNEHSGLQIMGYQVELYVQNLGEIPESNGIYDLEENDWIKEPNPDDIKSIGLNKFSIKDKAAKIMTIIDDMYDALASTDDSHQIEEMGNDASYLWKKVKNMRKNSLEKNGESGSGNIVYKILRRTGYLDRLFKLSNVVYDKSNSITESKNIIKEYLEKDYNLPLYKYFKWASTASSCEKAEDLAYSCSYYIGEYIGKIYFRYSEFENLLNDGEFDYEDESLVEMFLNMLEENNLCDHFISIMQDIVNTHGGYNELPSWCHMDFNRIVKNEWCIHFGSDSESIAKEGFTGGTEELDHLAYTNAGQEKPSEGYNFAFLIDDRNVDYNEYGNEAVIFRTSGVEIYHYGDNQNQVVFWGPNVKSFIPIHQEYGDWVVYGQNGQVLVRCGRPSEIALWATENLPQYRKQIMTGKNGYIPKMHRRNTETGKYERVPYPIYRNESIKKYLTLLKENFINEEWVGDGNSEHNPYKKRWDAERKALKDFLSNYGKLMQSRENGKLYKCYYDRILSQLIGYNYCICIQWDNINMKPKSVLYIRALDKFTPNIKQVNFDARGHDNVMGSYDDLYYQQ